MTDRIYTFLGLAQKAGRLVSGEDACIIALRSGKAHLVIVAGNASDNTKKRFTDMCKYRGIHIKFYGEKELLGRYTGKEIRSVVSILDQGFAKRIIEMIDEDGINNGGVSIVKSQDI